jgi:hypothetical protein
MPPNEFVTGQAPPSARRRRLAPAAQDRAETMLTIASPPMPRQTGAMSGRNAQAAAGVTSESGRGGQLSDESGRDNCGLAILW